MPLHMRLEVVGELPVPASAIGFRHVVPVRWVVVFRVDWKALRSLDSHRHAIRRVVDCASVLAPKRQMKVVLPLVRA